LKIKRLFPEENQRPFNVPEQSADGISFAFQYGNKVFQLKGA
jgi:hypothetical protein